MTTYKRGERPLSLKKKQVMEVLKGKRISLLNKLDEVNQALLKDAIPMDEFSMLTNTRSITMFNLEMIQIKIQQLKSTNHVNC